MDQSIINLNKDIDQLLTNAKKDNQERKSDLRIIEGYFLKLKEFKQRYKEIAQKVGKVEKGSDNFKAFEYFDTTYSIAKSYFEHRRHKIEEIQGLVNINEENNSVVGDISSNASEVNYNTNDKMANFDIKIALNLITKFDGKNETLEELINNVEYYDSILSNTEKPKLIDFVLKQRLTRQQRLKLNSSYESSSSLIADIRSYLLPSPTPQILNRRISTAKQGNRSILDYGRYLERLLEQMTIAQSEGTEQNQRILRAANEPNTVISFVEGLNDQDVRNAVRARNITGIRDAIQVAIEQDMIQAGHRENEKIFTFKRNSRGHYKGQNNRGNNNNNRGKGNYGNRGNSNSYSNRGSYNNNRGRGNYNNRGNGNNGRRGQGNSQGHSNGRYHGNWSRNSQSNVNYTQEEGHGSNSTHNNDETEQVAFFNFR